MPFVTIILIATSYFIYFYLLISLASVFFLSFFLFSLFPYEKFPGMIQTAKIFLLILNSEHRGHFKQHLSPLALSVKRLQTAFTSQASTVAVRPPALQVRSDQSFACGPSWFPHLRKEGFEDIVFRLFQP